MDYERIQKPQGGGGFSPSKLRTILLGTDKQKKEENELKSTLTLRSQPSDPAEAGVTSSYNCKDVDVVSILPECSIYPTADSLGSEMVNDRRLKDNKLVNSRIRNQEDSSSDCDSGHDAVSVSSAVFEFHKSERGPHRVPLAPFSKPPSSKWADAQKWIASPNAGRSKAQVPSAHGVGPRKVGNLGYDRQQSTKVVVEVPEQKMVAFEEPDTKQIDTSQTKLGNWGQRVGSWEVDPYPTVDSYGKPVLLIGNSAKETAISLSQHDSSLAVRSTMTFVPPPSTARSVSMRDMGTEMTPIASQEPSRNGTPVRATTPIRSPNSSRPSTPGRSVPGSSSVDPSTNNQNPKKELSEKEIQIKTRQEIMALGTQLGKMNIAAWASKEDEDKDASTSLKDLAAEKQAKSAIETRAAAWEEAEKAKYMARFKREEMKIQAWENHQKAKTEAEMRKIEVDVERMRGQAHDKLMNKLAAARHKAEEKRAVAEAKRNKQAAKTEQQVEYIRKTGQVPSSFSFCRWCF